MCLSPSFCCSFAPLLLHTCRKRNKSLSFFFHFHSHSHTLKLGPNSDSSLPIWTAKNHKHQTVQEVRSSCPSAPRAHSHSHSHADHCVRCQLGSPTSLFSCWLSNVLLLSNSENAGRTGQVSFLSMARIFIPLHQSGVQVAASTLSHEEMRTETSVGQRTLPCKKVLHQLGYFE